MAQLYSIKITVLNFEYLIMKNFIWKPGKWMLTVVDKGTELHLEFNNINDFDPFADQSGFMVNRLLNYRLGK